jgi:RNA polymerase sigma-70 factor (ECF subfamily)
MEAGIEAKADQVAEDRADAELVRSARSGDTVAAARLAEGSYEVVYRWLLRLVAGDREQAAELTQETFRIAWSSLHAFEARSRFTTWLYRIAYNAFLQQRRKTRRFVALPEGFESSAADQGPSPQESLQQQREAEQMRELILELPDSERFVVTARYWGGLTSGDIAALEGVGDAAIRKRLRKALRTLAAAYRRVSR